MSISVTTSPQYPVAERDIVVSFSVFGAGNYLKGFFIDAPDGSAIKNKLISTDARVPAFEIDANKSWIFSGDLADVGGVYTIHVDQYVKGTPYGGGYQDSPASFSTETLTDFTEVQIFIGQKVTQKLGVGADTATLTLFVVNDTIRASSETLHGFTSPFISDTKSQKAKTAALSQDVLAVLPLLVDRTSEDILGDLASAFNDIADCFNVHIASTTYHANADTNNTLNAAFRTPQTHVALQASIRELLRRLDQHMRNDTGGGTQASPVAAGTGTAAYHSNVESENALVSTSASGVLDTFVALADLWRAVTGHLALTTLPVLPVPGSGPATINVHAAVDPTTPASLRPLLALHQQFLAQLAARSPDAPNSVNPGVTALVHVAGFEEA